MAEAGPGAAGGYVAFISYSHKDAAIGRWLHRKLEGYRLPKRLAGTQGEDGEGPGPPDPHLPRPRRAAGGGRPQREGARGPRRVEEPHRPLLSPQRRLALGGEGDRYFPRAPPGPPDLHRDRRGRAGSMLSARLARGRREPLAADLRKEGDGRRLGLLKLVAGLAGVGLDASFSATPRGASAA
jgi:hypothetical protein